MSVIKSSFGIGVSGKPHAYMRLKADAKPFLGKTL
jgi:hypothetical protein